MPKKTSVVTLEAEAREPLAPLLHRGTHATRQVTRARILLTAAAGGEERAMAEALSVGRTTVARTRQRFVAAGLGARAARPRPGPLPKLAATAAARLLAAAWSTAPAGRQRWPVHRRAARVVALGLAASSASESVRRGGKTQSASRGGKNQGASQRGVRSWSPPWQTSWRSPPSPMIPHDRRAPWMRRTSPAAKQPGHRGLPSQDGRRAMLTQMSATARGTFGSAWHRRPAGGLGR